MKSIYKLLIINILAITMFLWVSLAHNVVLSALIWKTLKIIEKYLSNFQVVLDNAWVIVPNYRNIKAYIKTYMPDLAEKVDFDDHLTTELIIWIHYRENHNNVNYNPANWDWVFQLDTMREKVKNNIYCTKPSEYQQIYKTCIWPWSCKDFSKQLVYEYCDYIQFMKHKFKYINIMQKAIYWQKYWSSYIKWLKQKLQEIDVDIPDKLWKVLLDNLWVYLKENNSKTVDFTKVNFKFNDNEYWIKDFNWYIDYLQENYFQWFWTDKMFIRVLFEVFQDSVVVDYYNWLWANWWSRITKSYAMNIPKNFAKMFWIKPYVAKKPSWRWYLVDDAQVWAVVRYFYTQKPDLFKYILLIEKIWLK